MKVVMIGTVLSEGQHTDKQTGRIVSQVNVAVDDVVFRIGVDRPGMFLRFDEVVITGDLGHYERRWFLKGERIRLASRKDYEVISELGGNAVEADTTSADTREGAGERDGKKTAARTSGSRKSRTDLAEGADETDLDI